jgi:hypothetical protein
MGNEWLCKVGTRLVSQLTLCAFIISGLKPPLADQVPAPKVMHVAT